MAFQNIQYTQNEVIKAALSRCFRVCRASLECDSNWFIVFFASFGVGQSGYFGFDFMTVN